MTQNPAQQQQQPPPCPENSLKALRDAHAKQIEDCEKQARQSTRCQAQVEQFGTALGEIEQNVTEFDTQSAQLRREWTEAVRDWRCLWQAVRQTLNCDRGANCAALRKCIQAFDDATDKLACELEELQASLSGPLQAEFEKLQQASARSLEAYNRLLVASIQERAKTVRAIVEEAEKYNTGEVRDAALAYAILYAANRLVAGTETEVLGQAADDDAGNPNNCHCDDNDDLKAFVIPATTQQYERALVAAYCRRQADAAEAAKASDSVSASQVLRKRREEQILDHIRNRGAHLLKAAAACNLPQDDPDAPCGREPQAQGAA